MNTPHETPGHRWSHTLLALFLTALCALTTIMGLYAHALTLVVALSILSGGISRLIGAFKKDNVLGLLRTPFSPSLRWYRIQVLIRVAFVLTWLLAAKQNVDLLRFMEPESTLLIWSILAGAGLLFVALAIVPRTHISISTNIAFLFAILATLGMWGQGYTSDSQKASPLRSPFKSTAAVFQGGRGLLINHHFFIKSQRNALDLVVLSNGLIMKKNPSSLRDYFSFGAPLVAPASGKIVRATDHLPDQPLGTTNPKKPLGNHLVIAIGDNKFILLAHLKKGSLKVKKGQLVKAGQLLAQCGNSGNTSMPHLHIQLQSDPSFTKKGMRTFPILFKNTRLLRKGQNIQPTQPPRRGDVIEISSPQISKK